ncbi:MAG: tyrosine-type recombinase/integrase [Pseudorhodoplanes sp.]
MPKLKMTTASIERLKPPPHGQCDYFDPAFPALALRLSASGVRSWTYFGRVHGRLKRITLGRYPAMSLRAARLKAGEAADSMQLGVNPTAEKRAARRAPHDDFATVADDWLKRDQSQNRTRHEVARAIDRDVKPAWKDRPIGSIKRRDVLEVVDAIADRGAPIYARRVHAHLHRLFRWAVGRGIIEANPVADLPKPAAAAARDRVLSDHELVHVWNAAGLLEYPFGPLLRLLILTGARRDEIGSLRWSEIHGDSIKLSGERTKVGVPHTIPLSVAAQDIIAALPRIADTNFVFTTTGTSPVSGWSKAKTLLDAAIAAANQGTPLPGWRLHDLRRTLATGLQRLGIGLQVIERILGHVAGSRAGIVGVYQRHSFDDEARQALDAWARRVDALVSGKAANVLPMRRA